MNLRYALSLLHIFKIPGMFAVMQDWQAFLRMHFIFAAYESGLLGALGDAPSSKETLAEKLQVTRPELLSALLEVGLAVKELGFKDQQYYLKGKRAKAAANPKGDVVTAMIQANVSYYSDAYRHAADRLKGAPLGDDLAEIGDLVARFSKGIEPIVQAYIKEVAKGKSSLRILDVGCGSAFFLRSAHSVNPAATGVGLEIDPEVVTQARDNMTAWRLNDRFAILEGDIRNPPADAAGPFDLINLSNMLYYFSDEERADLLADMRARLSPFGMLSVMMNFHSRGKDLAAANLNLVNCSLKGLYPLPGVEQIKDELSRCGFRAIEEHIFLPSGSFLGITAHLDGTDWS